MYGNEQQGRFLTKYPEIEPTYYGTGITEDIRNGIFSRQLGNKSYELKDHLGNVRVTFSDIKLPTIGELPMRYKVDLLSKSEYYPYGMVIDELGYSAVGASTRYSYNSQEKDVELNNNMLSAEFWEYDARSARRWNNDPRPVTAISPYATFQGNPILFSDPMGDSIFTNKYGDITRNDRTDNMVFLQEGEKIQKIGALGERINITGIMPNLLKRNSEDAKGLGILEYKEQVQTDGDWDLKNNENTIFGLAWEYDENYNESITNKKKEKYTQFDWGTNYTFGNAADIGNYHAGYTGKYLYGGSGLPDNIL